MTGEIIYHESIGHKSSSTKKRLCISTITSVGYLVNKVLNYKLVSIPELKESQWSDHHPIVLSTGCFDILTPGHIRLLTDAKLLCCGRGIHIVALNSDRAVRELKGDNRPIYRFWERAVMLSALECVDFVVEMDDTDPRGAIQIIKPDYYVKGGDYTIEDLPEAALVKELGGEVRIVNYLPGYSTTRTIDRIISRS